MITIHESHLVAPSGWSFRCFRNVWLCLDQVYFDLIRPKCEPQWGPIAANLTVLYFSKWKTSDICFFCSFGLGKHLRFALDFVSNITIPTIHLDDVIVILDSIPSIRISNHLMILPLANELGIPWGALYNNICETVGTTPTVKARTVEKTLWIQQCSYSAIVSTKFKGKKTCSLYSYLYILHTHIYIYIHTYSIIQRILNPYL